MWGKIKDKINRVSSFSAIFLTNNIQFSARKAYKLIVIIVKKQLIDLFGSVGFCVIYKVKKKLERRKYYIWRKVENQRLPQHKSVPYQDWKRN